MTRSTVALLGLAVAVIAASPKGTNAQDYQQATLHVRYCPNLPVPTKEVTVWVTAYSSTPDQTDDTPFVTASGKRVRKGIVATNFLPFGTRVRIPELFGDQVFVVEDRMHRRKTNHLDIWMPSRKQAIRFGRQKTKIEIIDPV